MEYKIEIDIVLPCYNPPENWEKQMISNFKHLQSRFEDIYFHLIIVSDGSRQGYEPERITKIKETIPHIKIIDYRPNRGKGYALREAVKYSESPYTIYTDYDFPYTDESMQAVIEALLNGADIVVAVRDRNYQDGLPTFRKFLSKASHLCNQYLLRLDIKDTQGGLKGFNKTGREIFLSTHISGFLFDTEFIYKGQKRKVNIQPVSARIKDGLAISNMGMKVLRKEAMNFFSILFNR